MAVRSSIRVLIRKTGDRAVVLCSLLALLLNAGCANSALRHHDLLDTLAGLEHTSSLDPHALRDTDVLALDSDARRFIDSRTRDIPDTYEKLRALRRAVFAQNGLNFHFDEDLTLGAEATFRHAGGNCLALANFFVAAVRYLGIDAVYQEVTRRVRRREVATGGDDIYMIEQHINVSGAIGRGWPPARYVLDYRAWPRQDFSAARIIPDRRALAHYYNNLAMQRLAAGHRETALQYLKKALLADPEVAFVWSNLGVVYARRGDPEAAEFAYERALALDRFQSSARSNLELLREKMRAGDDAGHRRNHAG